MAQFPALPLWTDAYIADCSHLTFAAHGAYLSLLLLMWRTPDCRVPNDDEWIARKLRCTARAMQQQVRPVIAEFCEIQGKWIVQKRLQREWDWCKNKRQKNTNSANSRWNKDNPPCERNANAMPPSLTLSTPFKEVRSKKVTIGHSPDGFVDFWKVCPRKVAKGAAEKAWRKAAKEAAPERLIAAMKAYASATAGKDPDFIAHPATWLNQRRWEDETGKPSLAVMPKDYSQDAEHLENLKRFGVI